MCPIELFKRRILIKKPNELVEKRLQIAKKSKEVIQCLDIEQKTSLKKSLEKEILKWKNCFKWKTWYLIQKDHYLKATNLLCQNQSRILKNLSG